MNGRYMGSGPSWGTLSLHCLEHFGDTVSRYKPPYPLLWLPCSLRMAEIWVQVPLEVHYSPIVCNTSVTLWAAISHHALFSVFMSSSNRGHVRCDELPTQLGHGGDRGLRRRRHRRPGRWAALEAITLLFKAAYFDGSIRSWKPSQLPYIPNLDSGVLIKWLFSA